jgi:hypothetical protein
VGATTATTGAFTTVTATGNITSSGVSPRYIADGTTDARFWILNSATLKWQIGTGFATPANLVIYDQSTFQERINISSTGLAVIGAISATTTGKVGTTLGVGAATPSASGAGITFPATQSASSDANTLDDYEEGTWTPSVGGTSTYTQQKGSYIKVGRLVTVSFDMEITLLGTGSTTTISGLPFTVGSQTSPKMEQGVGPSGYFGSLAVNVYSLNFYASAGFTTVNSVSMNTLGGTTNVNPAIYGNSTRVQGTITYIATA